MQHQFSMNIPKLPQDFLSLKLSCSDDLRNSISADSSSSDGTLLLLRLKLPVGVMSEQRKYEQI